MPFGVTQAIPIGYPITQSLSHQTSVPATSVRIWGATTLGLGGQVWHLNRALGQLTDDAFVAGGLRCPEAYYWARGCYVANDNTPLLWTQANLWQALMAMDQTARLLER